MGDLTRTNVCVFVFCKNASELILRHPLGDGVLPKRAVDTKDRFSRFQSAFEVVEHEAQIKGSEKPMFTQPWHFDGTIPQYIKYIYVKHNILEHPKMFSNILEYSSNFF